MAEGIPLGYQRPSTGKREVTLGLYHCEVRKLVFCALPTITNMAVLRETIMNEIATQRQLIVHGDAEDTNMDGLATSNRVIYRSDGTKDMDESAVEDRSSSVKCYNCQKTGHISRNCTQKKQANRGTPGISQRVIADAVAHPATGRRPVPSLRRSWQLLERKTGARLVTVAAIPTTMAGSTTRAARLYVR